MWRLGIALLVAIVWWTVCGAASAVCQVPKSKDLDRQHDELVKDFINRTHKLALQYEQTKSYDRARELAELILKVAPDDQPARALLDKLHKQELTENKKVVKVMANQGWQKTGIQLLEGKPIVIEAKGDWLFVMRRTVNPDGLDVPDEMKRFPLGSLIGIIDVEEGSSKKSSKDKKERDPSRPFLIGSQLVMESPATGMLYVKMHDTEEMDNQGQVTVTISGQFRER